jgi:hypothetical protein
LSNRDLCLVDILYFIYGYVFLKLQAKEEFHNG